MDESRFAAADDGDEYPRQTALDHVPEQTTILGFDKATIERYSGNTPIRGFEEWLAKGYSIKKAYSMDQLAIAFGSPEDVASKTHRPYQRQRRR